MSENYRISKEVAVKNANENGWNMILLIDGASGIYSYHELINNYPLYLENGVIDKNGNVEYIKIENRLEGNDCTEGLFHPDNEEYCDNIDYYEPLYVKKDNGEYWRVESIDGDIFAINPKAIWSDTEDCYIMEEKDED